MVVTKIVTMYQCAECATVTDHQGADGVTLCDRHEGAARE